MKKTVEIPELTPFAFPYDAFGKPTIWSGTTQLSTSAVGNRFMFQGREYLSELGLYDYRHRVYHPGLGRFLQKDPTGFDAGDMNLFRYCADDPVNHSDPLGLYITYSDGWSKADAENYREQFAKEWAKPERRKEIEKAYADNREHVIFPDRSSGSFEKGATRFLDLTRTNATGLERVTERALDALKIVTGTLGPRPPKNFIAPTNPAQQPTTELPPGYTLRTSRPNSIYRNGSWRIYNERGQPVDPSTMKPPANVSHAMFEAMTHVEFPGPL